MTFVDTSILVRMADAADPHHVRVWQAVQDLKVAGQDLVIVPQNIYEFWAVATRPASANGLGLTTTQSTSEIATFRATFRSIPDRPALLAEWESLVVKYSCHGRISFDARLAAAMTTYGATSILTLNGVDFRRFPGIVVIDPLTVTP
jgi:predicted nucleic acid-binding protein